MEYKASFFDGKSAKVHTAKIRLDGSFIHIDFVSADQREMSLKWHATELIYEKTSENSSCVRFKNEPLIHLDCRDECARALNEWSNSRFVSTSKNRFYLKQSLLIVILVFALSLIPIGYFILLPILSDWAADNTPTDVDVEMGKSLSEMVRQKEHEIPECSRICTIFLNSLKQDSGLFETHVYVIKSKELNAFALPGGHIFIYSALLDSCQKPSQLAALLGHELAHSELRHTTRNIMRSLSGKLLLSLLISDYSGMGDAVLSKANTLKELSYSRALETEADEFGLSFLALNGLGKDAMIELFQTLKRAEDQSSTQIPGFLRTHPLSEERIQHVKNFHVSLSSKSSEDNSRQVLFQTLKRELKYNQSDTLFPGR